MKKLNLFILFSFCFSIITWGQANFAAIDSLIKKELPQGSEVGISVYDLTARKTLYTYRDTKLFASGIYHETFDYHYCACPAGRR